jgi:hypothetical protein
LGCGYGAGERKVAKNGVLYKTKLHNDSYYVEFMGKCIGRVWKIRRHRSLRVYTLRGWGAANAQGEVLMVPGTNRAVIHDSRLLASEALKKEDAMADGRELGPTAMHLKTMLTHVEEAQKIPDMFELEITGKELAEVLEPLGIARRKLTALYNSVHEDMEVGFLEDKYLGSGGAA